ncbi:EAL domain-containing protein [Kineococcus sp. TRM81007]|uniref:putative bifunctional diguanylate cyclase/phosphodiesterase n=1 Tax=Kineococcus sp. TRM81007 TaxID=2925831 RepID=UPI001F55D21E|nr:EAL domain-containing protein [Kineococcus sp. TRM81007]MCI2240574.1 EAL domain-containing protein [Kineococcus sp. TRM81007]
MLAAQLTAVLGLVSTWWGQQARDDLAWWVVQVACTLTVLAATGWVVTWRARRSVAERRVWTLLSISCAIYGAGVLGTVLFSVVPSTAALLEVPAAISAVLTFPLAYRAVVRWSRHGAGVDPDDLLNGISSALVAAAAIAAALVYSAPESTRAPGQLWASQLSWRQQLLDVEVAAVLVLVVAALTSASVSRLHRDARLWLLIFTYALINIGAVDALLHGGVRPSWSLPIAAVGLLALTAAALLPVRFVPTHASDPVKSTVGAFGVVAAGVTVIVTVLISDLPAVIGLCGALAVMGSSVRLLINLTELVQLATCRRQALTDELTGIANRRALMQELNTRLQRGAAFELLVFDLDHFKEVNDGLGHGAGDELLRMVTQRVQPKLPASALLGRLGGDEFAVIAPVLAPAPAVTASTSSPQERTGEHAEECASGALRVLRAAFSEPFRLGGMSVHVDLSIGSTTWDPSSTTEPTEPTEPTERARAGAEAAAGTGPGDEEPPVDAAALLRQSDTAMYEAKRNGLLVVAYDPLRHGDTRHLLSLVGELRHAVGAGQLRVHYQPQLHTGSHQPGGQPADQAGDQPGDQSGEHVGEHCSGQLAGVEALVRWQHPHLGLLAPGQFLPLAESHGLMDVVTREVLHQAVAQQAAWRATGRDVRVSVNLAAGTLLDASLPRSIEALLVRHAVPATLLVLEVTESALLREPERSLAVVQALRALGVQVSIDDFGTGYSSLTQLRQLPVDELKLDRAFTVDLLTDPRAAAIVANTIALAHALDLRVIAEGVEDGATLAALTQLGCDETQGYLHAKALPAPAFDDWLARREALTRTSSLAARTGPVGAGAAGDPR